MQRIIPLTFLIGILVASGFPAKVYAQNSDTTKVATEEVKGIKVTGVVRNAKTSEGISGINIAVTGYSAAITNEDGSFEINVPHLNAFLSVSGQDFQTKVHPLNNQAQNIEIILYENDYSPFYRTAKLPGGKALQYTNSKATAVVDFSEDQWSSPVNESVGDFLQGKIAGLNIIRKSGVPGTGAYINLRGFTSLYATNKPLIIVDGMIYDDEDYGSGIIQNNMSSSLSMIDVKDIEDVTVLKDGSALYGSKGANGVIEITTTRPTDLSTKIDFTVYGGINTKPDNLPVLNANQFRTYLTQAVSTRGDAPEEIANFPWMTGDMQSANYYLYNNQTNWQNQVFENTANQNYYLKIRGGDEIAKYGLSVGYVRAEGITTYSDLERYHTRLNASLKLTEKLNVNANLSFIHNTENQRDQGFAYKTNPMYLALTKSPFMPINAINANGEVSPNLADVDLFDIGNPLAIEQEGIGINKNYRFYGNLHFRYDFNENWNANLLAGLTYNKERENFFIPDFGVADITLPLAIAGNRSGSEVQRLYSIYTDAFLNFSKRFNNKHGLDVKLGLRSQNAETESDLGLGYNSATDDFTSVGAGSNLLRYVGGNLGEYNWLNIYVSTEYDYLNKYFIKLNGSVDGSSRFGSEVEEGAINLGENALSVLGSLSGAWLLSSENFLKNITPINLLKLRAGITFTGNDDIGNFTAQQYYVSQNLLGLQGLVRGNIGNPNLKWETIRKINLGTDIALFNERLNASLDVFENKTTNMITYQTANEITGFDYVVSNAGSMQTRGIELSLETRLVNTGSTSFDVGFNISRYENEVLSIPDDRIITEFGGASYVTYEGMDANLFYGYHTNGVYTTTAEAQASGLTRRMGNGDLEPFQGGDMIFTDFNGDNIIDEEDKAIIGNPNPDFFGSISANFTYKRFSISGLFNFSVGNDLYNGLRYHMERMSGYENQSIAVANRWRAEGQVTNIPRANWGDPIGNSSFSNRWIEDGSYLRLKTLVLNYNLDVQNMDFLRYINLYATANNLFTITDYLGYDPEFSATQSIFGQGADIGLMPQFRTIQLGLRLGL